MGAGYLQIVQERSGVAHSCLSTLDITHQRGKDSRSDPRGPAPSERLRVLLGCYGSGTLNLSTRESSNTGSGNAVNLDYPCSPRAKFLQCLEYLSVVKCSLEYFLGESVHQNVYTEIFAVVCSFTSRRTPNLSVGVIAVLRCMTGGPIHARIVT